MVRSPVVVFAIVCALFVLPSAAAAPATLRADVTMPIGIAGLVDQTASGGTHVVTHARAGTLSALVDARSLELAIVELWEEVPGVDLAEAEPQRGVRVTHDSLDGAHVRVSERLDGFTWLAQGGPEALFHATTGDAAGVDLDGAGPAAGPGATLNGADLRIFRLSAPWHVQAAQPHEATVVTHVLGHAAPYENVVPAGRFQLQAPDNDIRLYHATEGFIHGAVVQIPHATGSLSLELSERVEERPGGVFVPGEGWVGPGTHDERILTYLQWASEGAVASLTARDATTSAFVDRVGLGVAGHVMAARASGTVLFDDGNQRSLDGWFAGAGQFEGSLDPGPGHDRGRMTLQGDVGYLRTESGSESFPLMGTLAALAGLSTLAGLVAWMTKGSGAPLAIGLFSRVSRKKALKHEGRTLILDLVRHNPGIAPHEIVERTGSSWSTVTYHLEVLERTELLIAHRQGRYKRYFDRESGRYANGRKKLVSILQNEVTARIAVTVRANPGIVQRRLAEQLSMAPSSIHWHVARLVDAGLVVKTRVSRTVELAPGPKWAELDETDLPLPSALTPPPPAASAADKANGSV